MNRLFEKRLKKLSFLLNETKLKEEKKMMAIEQLDDSDDSDDIFKKLKYAEKILKAHINIIKQMKIHLDDINHGNPWLVGGQPLSEYNKLLSGIDTFLDKASRPVVSYLQSVTDVIDDLRRLEIMSDAGYKGLAAKSLKKEVSTAPPTLLNFRNLNFQMVLFQTLKRPKRSRLKTF